MAPVQRWRRVASASCCAMVGVLVLFACDAPAPEARRPTPSVPSSPPPRQAVAAAAAPASTEAAAAPAPKQFAEMGAFIGSVEGGSVKRRAVAPASAPTTGRSIDDLLGGSLGVVGYGVGGGGLGMRGVGGGVAMARMGAIQGEYNTESYARVDETNFVAVSDQPLSTFSIDVDTASYSNVRRYLRNGSLPPPDAVRVEEMLNYFHYRYPAPTDDRPFSVHTEVAAAPWAPAHRLLLVGLQARTITQRQTPPRNLVFLIDVSGSMASPDKLPLLKGGLTLLARQLRQQDRIAIVVYAGASGLALPTTAGDQHATVIHALDRLESGGSTNGAEGIELAYRTAQRSFIRGGVNRVVLATDGDFNVGVTSHGDLTRLIEEKRETGVFLSVLGFGGGNLKDSTMEALADRGNGNYAYIDSMREAERALVRQAGGTLVTLAKDVKIQVELNPAQVKGYRLIGYDNRRLATQDFNDDRKDAGEIGAGHSVTALYEIIPQGSQETVTPKVDPLRYQDNARANAAAADELATIKIRYKQPDESESTRFSVTVRDNGAQIEHASHNLRWASAIAGFGMILGRSQHRGDASMSSVLRLARTAADDDPNEDRAELLELMRIASGLTPDSRLQLAR